MGIVISTICSTTYDVRMYRPIQGKAVVESLGESHGVFTSTIATVESIDLVENSKTSPSCTEKGALECMMFSSDMSGVMLDTQTTIAEDGGTGATPYTQKIITMSGVF